MAKNQEQEVKRVPGVDADPPTNPADSAQRDGIDAEEVDEGEQRSPREIAEDLEFDDTETPDDEQLDEEQLEDVPDGEESDIEDDPDQVDGAADPDDEIDFDAEFEGLYGPAADPPARKTVAGKPAAGDDDDVSLDEVAEAADLGDANEDDDIPLTRGELRKMQQDAKAKRQQREQERIRESVTTQINSRINEELNKFEVAEDQYRRPTMIGEVWGHLGKMRRTYTDADIAKIVRLVAQKAERAKGGTKAEGTRQTQRERNRVAAPSPREARPGKTDQGKPKRSTDGKVELDLTNTRATDQWMRDNFRD